MPDFLKTYWGPAVTIVTAIVALTMNYALTQSQVRDLATRMSSVEARQDRQGASISTLQDQVNQLASDVSGMKSDIGAIKDNVNYIRNRIDAAVR